MNLTVTVLEIITPIFLLASVGFVWVRLGFDFQISFVTRLAMSLSLPCLVFSSLMQSGLDPDILAKFTLSGVAAYGVTTLVFAALVWALKLNTQTYLAPLTFGNTGNLGLPLALFAFGETGLQYAIILFAIMAVWSFTFGIWVVAGRGSTKLVLREPLAWASILGALFLWQGWHTPPAVTNTLDLIGQMAIPLMLITLGVAVAQLTPAGLGRAAILAGVKLILCVAIAWGIGCVFMLDHVAFGTLVLQLATPVAVTSYLIADKYGADTEAVAGLVLTSTFMAVAALPLLLAFLL